MFKSLETAPFGVLASHDALPDMNVVDTPAFDQYGSAPTLNTMGSVLIKSDPIVDEFVTFATDPTKLMLDVGTGYGVTSLAALEQGARVVANDIDARHLLVLRHFTPVEERERLYLKTGAFPFELNFPEKCFDGILLRRIIHFLSAEAMDEVFSKVALWLKPGGCLFIVCMSPYHQYLPGFIDEYERRWASGNLWPGVIHDLRAYNVSIPPEVPDFIHVMDERPLLNAIKPHFNLVASRFFDYQPGPILESHKAFYGMIAQRK